MKRLLVYFLVLIVNLSVSAQSWTAYPNTSIASYSNGYYEYLPAGYDGVKKFPLLVFMHGVGESGNGNTQLNYLTVTGTPMYIQRSVVNGKVGFDKPMIIIAIQAGGWSNGGQANDVINWALKNRAIDQSRIYVTGLSMGGGATMEFAASWGHKVAAVFPICAAAGMSAQGMDSVAKWGVGMYALHAADDNVCPVNNTIRTVDGLNARGIKPVAEKVIPATGGHGVWNNWYDPTSGFYEKVLTYQRGKTDTTAPPPVVVPPPTTIRYSAFKAVPGWTSDQSIRTGGQYTNTMMIWGAPRTISGTTEQEMYSQEVFDASQYRIPVANGTYTVRLHFTEIFHNSAGRRIFNVNIEGQRVLNNFDIYMLTGARFVALQRDFQVAVNDNTLNIDFINVVDKAKIAGIEVIPGVVIPPTLYISTVSMTDSASGKLLKQYTDTFLAPVKVTVKQ